MYSDQSGQWAFELVTVNDCLMTVFFFLDNIGVNAMYITVKKIKHNKIDKGGEGEEGGFKPQAIMFWKVKLA